MRYGLGPDKMPDNKLDTYQKRAKVPSQELSDYLVKELTKKEK